MALASGVQLGPYEILAALGAGGMGEVYRARDSRLGRDVAIKILPAAFSADADRLRRFEQEARAAAALNHPNILAVHDIGTHDGAPYVVSELLEGTTLREALTAGPLPVRKALDYAIQICNGLAAAHEKGVVHRDLKPENLFITRDGRVKILDFGLAKLTEARGAGAGVDVSMVATHTVDTTPGLVMGTVGYMSPEQVRGQVVDRRSDLFSVGAIVYEMLSGDRAFTGDTAADTMSAILTKEPRDLTATHGEVSPTLERVVCHCLEKTPEQRFQSAGDLAFAIAALPERSSSGAVPMTSAPIRSLFRWRERLAWIAACFAIALVAILWTARRVPTMGPEVRFSVPLPEKTSFGGMALSPDGTTLAFVAESAEGISHIVLRPLDGLASRVLPGTDEAEGPFWSPDSRYLAFCQKGKLKKMALAGGATDTLCDCPNPQPLARGAWSRDGYIVFAPAFNLPLSKVADTGGSMTPVTAYAPSGGVNPLHTSPILLPDGRHLLYSVGHFGLTDAADSDGIFIASLDSTATSRLIRTPWTTLALVDGQLLYTRGRTLVAQPFDARALTLTGEPTTLAEDIGPFDAVPGVLAYTTDDPLPMSQLTWFDRGGRSLGSVGERRLVTDPRLSPDGTRLAISLGDFTGGSATWDTWIADLGRDVETRLTFNGFSMYNIWSPMAGTSLSVALPTKALEICSRRRRTVGLLRRSCSRPIITSFHGTGRRTDASSRTRHRKARGRLARQGAGRRTWISGFSRCRATASQFPLSRRRRLEPTRASRPTAPGSPMHPASRDA
jgi:hypothetical protein